MSPRKIAVLGGGLTGLSSAFYLSRRFPKSQIILLEKQAQLGGWVKSQRIDLPTLGASVLIEGGPRTLRPNNRSALELVNLLELKNEIITVPKSSLSAKSRYLYIPEGYSTTSGLQRLPSSIISLVSSPLFPMIFSAVLREPFKRSNRPSNSEDDNVDSFFTRRFGEAFALTFGSALVHGIYATDSRQLSTRAAFPAIWNAESRGRGSIIRGLLTWPGRKLPQETYDLGGAQSVMEDASVYSFRNGMQTLTAALTKSLRLSKNVDIIEGTEISSLNLHGNRVIEISHSLGSPLQVTHAVSALPLPILDRILRASQSIVLPNLTINPLSSVRVVNFIFPCPPKNIHPEGFGYLIPRPPDGYPADSPDSTPGILGTVFDSCSLHEQDTPQTANYYADSPITKLTMMTGGPYLKPPLPDELSSSPGDKGVPPLIGALLQALRTQLGRHIPDPVYWRIWNNEECIPTLTPGHLGRMDEMRCVLQNEKTGWGGRLEVIGAGVGGVSVGDCIQAGRGAGKDWN